MARAVAFKENGRWLIKVDVDNYAGDTMGINQARQFAKDVTSAAQDAQINNERDKR